MENAVEFAYGGWKKCKRHNKGDILLVDVDLLYMSDEKEGPDDYVSRNTGTTKMTCGGDENKALDTRSDDLIDATIAHN